MNFVFNLQVNVFGLNQSLNIAGNQLCKARKFTSYSRFMFVSNSSKLSLDNIHFLIYLTKLYTNFNQLHADSSFVPPLIYSLLGSSRHLGVGPVSIASLVMGSMLSEAVSSAEEPILYLKLAFTATFFAGLFQASLGLLRYSISFILCSRG